MSFVLIALLYSTRPLDPIATDALELALRRSATVRALVDTLERSNVVVHIHSSRELPDGIAGITRFVTSRGGYRYLRITIDADLPPITRGVILAHELQHAREIAESGADTHAGVRELFERCGHRAGPYFETQAARDTERGVRAEMLSRSRMLQTEPVVKFDH